MKRMPNSGTVVQLEDGRIAVVGGAGFSPRRSSGWAVFADGHKESTAAWQLKYILTREPKQGEMVPADQHGRLIQYLSNYQEPCELAFRGESLSKLIDFLHYQIRECEDRSSVLRERLREMKVKDGVRLREKLEAEGPLKAGEVDEALEEARELRTKYENGGER